VSEQRTESRVEFSVFFGETWPDVLAFVLRLIPRADLAEEIAQESLTRVYVRYPLLRDPRPYTFKIAANLTRRAWREPLLADVRQLDTYAMPSRGLQGLETLDAVHRLPARLSQVVLLHYYADQPIEEIAQALRRPVGTIKRRLHEARQILGTTLVEAQL
jgi:RNA polymerase sigma-70 factor (ECF subfamily)